jgi:hypothetical protein
MREGEPHQDHTSRRIDRAWLGGSLLLVAFGLFAAASIGIPIAVGGLVLLIIKCPRGRRAVCSVSVGVAVGLVVLVLSLLLDIEPGCGASAGVAPGPGQMPGSRSCTLLGVKGPRAPTWLPALAMGSIAGAIAASGFAAVTGRRKGLVRLS